MSAPRRSRPGLRRSLLTWFVTLATALVAATTAVLYAGTRGALFAGLDAELRARAEGIAARTEWDDDHIVLEGDEDATDASLPAIDGYEVRTWPELTVVVHEGLSLPACTAADAAGAQTHGELRVVGTRVDRPARSESGEQPGEPFAVVVRVARSTAAVQQQLDRVWLLALATLTASLLAVVAFGVVVSRRVIAPLHHLATAARQVQDGSATAMPDRGTGDEVDALANVLDGAFAALRAATDRQRRFTADASHELRTPLAIVQNTAEVALHRPREADDYRNALGDVVAAAQRMQAMLEALLTLARLDAGAGLATGDLDLREAARDAIAAAPTRPDVAVTLLDGPPSPIRGDARLLAMLFGNLLTNAVRHAQNLVTVHIEATETATAAVVTDDGKGLPADERARLFERFFRGRNSAGHPGSGLGLAIVAAIATTHGATITAEDNNPGLRIRVQFPRRSPN